MIPSLYRDSGRFGIKDEAAFRTVEDLAVQMFFRMAVQQINNQQRSPIRDLVMAQHYGVPTRLLDWSSSPLVALFFSVSAQPGETDSAFYVVAPTQGFTGEGINYPPGIGIHQFHPFPIDARIFSQKSVFTVQGFGESSDGFQPLDDRDWTASSVDVSKGNSPLPWLSTFLKVRIAARTQATLLKDLRSFGVDYSALFPGLEGVGRHIAMRLKDEIWLDLP